MLTFNTPCLRWKLVLTTKNQNGWPGFIAPYQTRYLDKLVVIQSTPAFGYGTSSQAPTTTRTQAWVTDRLTGIVSSADGNENVDANFPYTETLNQTGGAITDDGYESWQVSDTQFTHTLNWGGWVTVTQVTLSNPYTLEQLDADANAQLASVSIASQPWNTLQFAPSTDDELSFGPLDPEGNLMDLLPAQVTYPGVTIPGPSPILTLNAAAWYVFAPGDVVSQDWLPNAYSKLIGYVAMAGNYCQKTFWIDDNQNLLNQTCVNGVGSCSSAFKVTPPAPVAGQNAYVMIVPNCQCCI